MFPWRLTAPVLPDLRADGGDLKILTRKIHKTLINIYIYSIKV